MTTYGQEVLAQQKMNWSEELRTQIERVGREYRRLRWVLGSLN